MHIKEFHGAVLGLLYLALFLLSLASLIWLGVTLIDGEPATKVSGDDYGDAPDAVQDGSLDYQDYKELGCPHLDQSLDQRIMKECNQWVRENNITSD